MTAAATGNERLPRLYGYGCDDEDDAGWGCVYRSVQNAQSSLGLGVLSVEALVHSIGRPWGSWSEPADFVPVLQSQGARVHAFLAGAPDMRLTKRAQYFDGVAFPSAAQFAEYLIAASQDPSKAFVLDDGVSGFAVLRGVFVDPHSVPPRVTRITDPVTQTMLRRASGWMVLEVGRA